MGDKEQHDYDVRQLIEQSIENEVAFNIKNRIAFTEPLHAWAVIEEERVEVLEEMQSVNNSMETLFKYARANMPYCEFEKQLEILKKRAIMLAHEAIQIAACAEKAKENLRGGKCSGN